MMHQDGNFRAYSKVHLMEDVWKNSHLASQFFEIWKVKQTICLILLMFVAVELDKNKVQTKKPKRKKHTNMFARPGTVILPGSPNAIITKEEASLKLEPSTSNLLLHRLHPFQQFFNALKQELLTVCMMEAKVEQLRLERTFYQSSRGRKKRNMKSSTGICRPNWVVR